MRVGVYTDYSYSHDGEAYYSERAFFTFITRLAGMVDKLVLFGRLNPGGGRSHYRVPDEIDFVPLPFYESQADARAAVQAMARSLRAFWRNLDEVDVVWLLGPHPLAIVFAALAAMRRKRVVLGVRQDMPVYTRSRHPGKRWMMGAAYILEYAFRLMSRVFPVVVVGPQLAANYRGARRLLTLSVSLVAEDQIVDPRDAAQRVWNGGELRVLTVSRLETEKNPLLLADVLAQLRQHDTRFRLLVCGEGPMEGDLRRRLEELGVADHADLLGYVPITDGLLDVYRSSHAFLHVSWTEGLPQTLFEAFAAGLPVVATAVGGVPDAVGQSALLVEPGDPVAPAEQLRRLADDPGLRGHLIESGVERVRSHTLEAESRRVVEFLGS
ncbi:MAG TPA: glycosyltransferase [Solirubrobacterales bacterium]|nr:glycosyltransferase [Solirubrobacterales bacterium]